MQAPKLSSRDAVSRAVAKALDAYHQAGPGSREAGLAGRVFEAYLRKSRQAAWAAGSAGDLARAVGATTGPLPEWVTGDLV